MQKRNNCDGLIESLEGMAQHPECLVLTSKKGVERFGIWLLHFSTKQEPRGVAKAGPCIHPACTSPRACGATDAIASARGSTDGLQWMLFCRHGRNPMTFVATGSVLPYTAM